MKVRIAGLNKNDFTNGIGICVSLFLQGCPHHCPGCHSESTWDPEGGTEVEYNELLQEIKDAIHANGVLRNFSISGGDPLAPYNLDATLTLLYDIRAAYPDIKFCIWTGYPSNWAIALLENQTWLGGTLLITEPFDITKRDITLPLRGSCNQRIWELPNKEVTKNF
jgi:anaerobic ribonucleoside-triphosphate reductase activating protein